MSFAQSTPSTQNVWPTKDNPVKYKINSFWVDLSKSLNTIERQTYSILEWTGDVGGLLDGLKLIGGFIIAPIASMALKLKLIQSNTKLAGKRFVCSSSNVYHLCSCTKN